MTRYVEKPHGLTIVSGNLFSFGHDGGYREFPCMLEFNRYNLGQDYISQASVSVQTPATQLCWFEEEVPLPITGSRAHGEETAPFSGAPSAGSAPGSTRMPLAGPLVRQNRAE